MLEHNNRQIAKKHAKYITSKELRKYVANKVKQYAPNAKRDMNILVALHVFFLGGLSILLLLKILGIY